MRTARAKGLIFFQERSYDRLHRYSLSNWRTFDPEKAQVFLIPFDLFTDFYAHPSKLQFLKNDLFQSKYFVRNKGSDHIMFSAHVGFDTKGIRQQIDLVNI